MNLILSDDCSFNGDTSSDPSVQVLVRIRPPIGHESKDRKTNLVVDDDCKTLRVDQVGSFKFDWVAPPCATQVRTH